MASNCCFARAGGICLAALVIFGAIAVLGLGTSAQASVVASESFVYTSGQAMNGQNGGSGWGSPWAVTSNSSTVWPGALNAVNGPPATAATNLAASVFGGTGDAGGSMQFGGPNNTPTANNAGAASRAFSTPIATTTPSTLWGSVGWKANSTEKFQYYYQLTFNDTPANPANGLADSFPLPANGTQHALNLLGIGATPVNASNSGSGNPFYYADADNGVGVQLNATANTAQYEFVFKIELGSTDPNNSSPAIKVSSWGKGVGDTGAATFLSTDLGTPTAVQYYDLSAAEQAGNVTGVRIQSPNQNSTTNNRWYFVDEIKFGTSTADVGAISSVPEVSSVVMVGLVCACGLLARRSGRR